MASRDELIEAAPWDVIGLQLTSFADVQIRRHAWLGEPAYLSDGHVVLADGRNGEDYALEAIHDLLDPNAGRKWDHEKNPDILDYLKSAVKSMISNASRRLENRTTVRSVIASQDDSGDVLDRFDVIPDAHPNAADCLELDERVECQKAVIEQLRASVSEDPELKALLEALENDIVKNRDIEELTGILAARVSELKRKLRDRLERIQPTCHKTLVRGQR